MKRVGVREFRDHATQYLAGNEPLTIERHGEPIGYYFPADIRKRDPEAEATRRAKLEEAVARLDKTIREILDRTGMTEEEFSRYFDLSEPLPDDPMESRAMPAEHEHALGR